VEVLQIRNTGKRCGAFHERFALSFSRSGSGTVRYRRRTAEHDRGSLFFLEPGEVHSSPAAIGLLGWDVLFVEPSRMKAAAAAAGMRGAVHWRSIVARDHEAVYSFKRALAALGDDAEPNVALCALDDLLAVVLRHHAEGGAAPKERPRDTALVRRLKSRLHDQVIEGVSLDELAADCGVSACHLVRCFSADVGIPPHQYLLHLRVERARELLTHGKPSTEVAHELGFSDQSHFNRHFTRIVDVPPGRYARAARRRGPNRLPHQFHPSFFSRITSESWPFHQ
jgi:AraC-like DNA-binding protein